jgi:hypothetical protein
MEIGYYGRGESVGGQILVDQAQKSINATIKTTKEKKCVEEGLVVGCK